MHDKPQITAANIKQAYIIAVVADALQLPLILTMVFTITIPFVEVVVIGIDIAVMLILSKLLGFHWALLPCFVLEVIPGLDLIPTWTACTAFVVSQRKKEMQGKAPIQAHMDARDSRTYNQSRNAPASPPSVIEDRRAATDIQDAEIVEESPRRTASPPPVPTQLATENGRTIESRLERLARLHQQGVITEDELKAKRQQVLDEL